MVIVTCGSLDVVLTQHMTEAMSLQVARRSLVRAPHVSVFDLRRLDERLESHLDGLLTVGARADEYTNAALANGSREAAFVAVVTALKRSNFAGIQAIVRAIEDPRTGWAALTDVFGWVEPSRLQGIVRDLLTCVDPIGRVAGLAACALHRVDPGLETGPWLGEPAAAVRARALRGVGELGLHALAPRCLAALSDEDAECRFWAAWSAVLLGVRGNALGALRAMALDPDAPYQPRAFRLALQATDTGEAHGMLQAVARDKARRPWLIQGSGIVGDATYVPWLLGHMAVPETARSAGEAFTLITGADLDALQLWCSRPADFESGPSENPEDEDVELDPDEGLMWPDAKKVEQWWAKNGDRFQPGTRYFMGAPVTREHCINVLKNGYQRQRILAAHYLCLVEPGSPLFNTSAPAWRQQKLLAQMS